MILSINASLVGFHTVPAPLVPVHFFLFKVLVIWWEKYYVLIPFVRNRRHLSRQSVRVFVSFSSVSV